MGNLLHTFAISGDTVIGIVAVVIWIWLSVMSRRGKAERQAPPSADGSRPPQDPASEMRKFFEALEKGLDTTGEPHEPEAAPAKAFQPPRKTVPPALPRQPPKPPPGRTPRPIPPVPAAAMAAPPPPPPAAEMAIASVAAAHPSSGSGAFPALPPPRMGFLRSREGLRQAVVAAEILGPPLSMRQPSANAGRI